MRGGTIAHGRQQHGRSWRSFSVTACFRVLGAAGRLGGWGHAVRRPVFTAGRVPVAVRPRRARCASCGVDACSSSGVAAGAPVRRDGGDRGHARAGGPGAGVPVDRGGVAGCRRARCGTGCAGSGRSAGRVREFFTRLAGVLAVDPVPLDPAGSALGDAVVAVAAAAAAAAGRWPGSSRCRPGSWRPWSRWGRFCPRLSPSARFAGTCCRLPWRDGSTRVPLCPGRLLPVTLGGPAGAGSREGTRCDDCGRGGSRRRGWSGPGRRACSGTRWCRSSLEPGLTPGGAGLAGQGAGRPCPRGAGRAAGHGVVRDADPVAARVMRRAGSTRWCRRRGSPRRGPRRRCWRWRRR